MDENDSRELARLYKIANAIGNCLDTEAVLSAALSAFVEQLACSAGAIYLDSSAVVPDAPIVARPSSSAASPPSRSWAMRAPSSPTSAATRR